MINVMINENDNIIDSNRFRVNNNYNLGVSMPTMMRSPDKLQITPNNSSNHSNNTRFINTPPSAYKIKTHSASMDIIESSEPEPTTYYMGNGNNNEYRKRISGLSGVSSIETSRETFNPLNALKVNNAIHANTTRHRTYTGGAMNDNIRIQRRNKHKHKHKNKGYRSKSKGKDRLKRSHTAKHRSKSQNRYIEYVYIYFKYIYTYIICGYVY